MKMAMAACTSLSLDLPPRSVLLDYRQAVDKITLQLRRYKQTMCYNCLLVKNIFSFSIWLVHMNLVTSHMIAY